MGYSDSYHYSTSHFHSLSKREEEERPTIVDPPKDKHESLRLAWHVSCDFNNMVHLNDDTGLAHIN